MQMGPRSRLVLAKLGADLRALYDDVLDATLPRDLRKRVERLPVLRDVIDVRTVRPASPADAAPPAKGQRPPNFIVDDGGPLL